MLEPKVDKSDISMSFYINNELKHEFIPADVNKFEAFLHRNFRKILDYANVPNYYWHYRYLLDPTNKKIEDLKFMIHVYQKHGGEPTDKYEKRHYSHACRLYANEFTTFIIPKLDNEDVGRGISHYYAVAYYKKWLKPINSNFSRMYHGVDKYEMLDMYDELMSNIRDQRSKQFFRQRYHDRKAKLLSNNKPKSTKKHKNEKEILIAERKLAYKNFKIIYGAIDLMFCFLIVVYIFGGDGVDKSFIENIYIMLGVTVFWQILFAPIFYTIKFFRFHDIN